jgi:copper homeostasis protein
MSNKAKIEICVNSVEAALQAQKAGAGRIVLCAGNVEWGTTPSFGAIRMARQVLDSAQLHVLIRPRVGDFLYSPTELEVMLHDVKVARQLGADGVVIGCLMANGRVDVPAVRKLVNGVGTMEVTFGRAFDLCSDPDEALEELASAGVHRILTSGQVPNVVDALPRITEWVKQYEGKLTFILTNGITTDNLVGMAESTQCREFHVQAATMVESAMLHRSTQVHIDGMLAHKAYAHDAVDAEALRAFAKELDKVNEKDAALEKLLREAKAKKKKSRRHDDEEDDDDL